MKETYYFTQAGRSRIIAVVAPTSSKAIIKLAYRFGCTESGYYKARDFLKELEVELREVETVL